jgi:hypothetical protein
VCYVHACPTYVGLPTTIFRALKHSAHTYTILLSSHPLSTTLLHAHTHINHTHADVAAKENAQETFVTLVGIVGGLLFAHSANDHAWPVFIFLTWLHVYANYKGAWLGSLPASTAVSPARFHACMCMSACIYPYCWISDAPHPLQKKTKTHTQT